MALDSEQQQQPQVSTTDPSLSRNSSFNSRLNAHAPEFVPNRSTTNTAPQPPQHQQQLVTPFHAAAPHQHHYMHHHQQQQNQRRHYQNHQRGGVTITEYQHRYESDDVELVNNKDHDRNNNSSEDSTRKILNQVEYYFSDLNLATTDHLMRYINKDPEGYVPISVVASFRKFKTLISNISHLATILRSSSKLVVSEDGKKVRRQQPLTESDMDELHSCIVVAENLREDHCHQNLMKIFSAVGSVKTIRTCLPQISGGGSLASRSAKSDNIHFSNKLHAFVEYESVELAEKAAKSAQPRGRKSHDGEGQYEEDDASTSEQVPNEKQLENTSHHSDFNNSLEHGGEEHVHEKEGVQRKGHDKSRSTGHGRNHNNHHNNSCGNHVGSPSNNNMVSHEHSVTGKLPPGPRMPDGTRGFSMGRGKPITA